MSRARLPLAKNRHDGSVKQERPRGQSTCWQEGRILRRYREPNDVRQLLGENVTLRTRREAQASQGFDGQF